MYEIRYVVGDATAPEGDSTRPRIIVHICNDRGGWGKGFVVALARRYPAAETSYRTWYAGRATNDFALGSVRFVPVEANLYVANLIGQHGYRTENGTPPVRYEAIRTGLQAVAEFAKSVGTPATVHMPRIGCGLAGGDWGTVSAIIDETLGKETIPVTVYDL
jgi:O-acetyl-ADP-ribose deacetylase (regulator of RNase III)